MKNLLLTLALLISFSSFTQTYEDIVKNDWSETSVKAFYDSFKTPLGIIEGIYTFQNSPRDLSGLSPHMMGKITNQEKKDAYYKLAIFYFEEDDIYRGYIMDFTSKEKNWKKGDLKIELEGSALGGDYDVKWYRPAKGGNDIFYRAVAIEGDNGQQIEFIGGDMNSALEASGVLFKRYPKLLKISKVPDEETIDNSNVRAKAIKELKEAKEMLDLGILSKEEYEIIADRLKPIIIGN